MAGPVPSGIDDIGLLPGSHVCACYRSDSDRDRLVNGYLGAGVTARDKCICAADSAVTAARLRALPQSRAEPGPNSQLNIHLPETTYLAGEMTWALRGAPGVTVAQVRATTGFGLQVAADLRPVAPPSTAELAAVRSAGPLGIRKSEFAAAGLARAFTPQHGPGRAC